MPREYYPTLFDLFLWVKLFYCCCRREFILHCRRRAMHAHALHNVKHGRSTNAKKIFISHCNHVFRLYGEGVYGKRLSSVSLHEHFTTDENIKGIRGHSCRLLKTRCTRDIAICQVFFLVVISRWNLLDQRTVDDPSINVLKSRLVCVRDSRMGFFMD